MFRFQDDSTADERKPLIPKAQPSVVNKSVDATNSQMDTTFDFKSLPPDIARLILCQLRRKELARLAQVSKATKEFAENNIYWKEKAARDLPIEGFTTAQIINTIQCDDSIPGIRKKFYRNTMIANINDMRYRYLPVSPCEPLEPRVPVKPTTKEKDLCEASTLGYGFLGAALVGTIASMCVPPCFHPVSFGIVSGVGGLLCSVLNVGVKAEHNIGVRNAQHNYLNYLQTYPYRQWKYQVDREEYERQSVKYNQERNNFVFFYPKAEVVTDNAVPPEQPLMIF